MWLPPPERSHEVQFYLAKALPYRKRLSIAFSLMAAGLLLQMFSSAPSLTWLGVGGVVAGVVMLLVKGYQNKPKGLETKAAEWKTVSRQEVERIIEINEQQRRWDQSAVDITCGRGCGVLILATVVFMILNGVVSSISPGLGGLLFINGAVMLLPFWLTGVRFILKNDSLIVKTRILLRMDDSLNLDKRDGEEFQFQIQTSKAKGQDGEVPADIKAILLFHNGPPSFLGLQMQVAINEVQGNSYPYFYCVLVARTEFRGLSKQALSATPPDVILESKRENEVDIVVIRQYTTRTSGYHTKDKTINAIFFYALEQARQVIAQAAK